MKSLFTIKEAGGRIPRKKISCKIPITLLLVFIVMGDVAVKAQNIYGPEGVNWVGVPEGYSQPTNGATGDYRVLKYREVSTTTSNPGDGRGQWVTTINVQTSGGNFAPYNMTGGGGNGFLFTSGPSGNQFGNKWCFGGVAQGAVDGVNGMSYQGSTDMGLNMSATGYYTFVMKDAGYGGTGFYVGLTTNAPVTISHNVSNNTYSSANSATINFTVSGTPSSQENFYIRYLASSSNFDVAGTSFAQATMAGTSGSATISGLTSGTTYYYYIFSSTRSLSNIQSDPFADVGYECLNYADNSGNDYSFTAGAAPVISSASPTGTYGQSFSYNISATNTPSSYAITSGSLPAGLSLNTGSGAITGTPTALATSSVVGVSATNGSGTGTGTLTFTINKASLTITANNITKCSGATYTFAGTEFSSLGLVNGDAVSSVTLMSAGAPAAATTGVYSITPSAAVGTGLSNYNINYNLGLMTVETLTLMITQVNPDCYSDPGSLSGSVTGGTAPYMYEVNSGLTYLSGPIVYGPSTTPLYSPAAPGYYTYSVTDAAGCFAKAERLSVNALTQTPLLLGAATAPSTLAICYGNTKTITTIPIGGATPYTYSLNSNGVSGPFVASASRYFNVPAGTYYITVKDNVGCTYITNTMNITQPSAGVSFTTSIGGQACATLGGIVVTAAGGYGGYTYSDNNGSSYQSNNMFSGLAYGNYTVKVQDENGCVSSSSVVKFTPLISSAITAAKNPICPNGTTTIYTVPSGGTPPYSYSLDGLAYVPSNDRYFNVTPGTHAITVQDNVSCTYGPVSITINTGSCASLEEGTEELQKVQPAGKVFEAHLSPNPTMASFHLQIQSNSREDVALVVTNMQGVKVYEAKGGIDNTYEFGGNLKGGMYILQIMQGNEVHAVKLVKGN